MSASGERRCDEEYQALEIEIERAWVLLGHRRGPFAVRLTRMGRLVGITRSSCSEDGDDVGTYTSAIGLAEFREDVFFVYESRGRT